MPAFFKILGASFRWDPPAGGVGVGQEWVGGFGGKGYIPGAKGAGKFFPLYFPLCWSVGEWVGASWVSSPPPLPGVGVGQVLCVPPCRFCPPPPPLGLL